MKKLSRILLKILGVIILIALIGFLFIEVRGIPGYEVKKIDYKAEVTPQRVERGKKIALMLCANCHMDREAGKLTGHKLMEAPREFGTIYSQNITQDKQYGIGDWTDGELLYLLRTGIKRDGQYSPPWMAKLPHLSDEDIASIIAFLHSDDPMVAAAAVPDQPCEPSFLSKFLCLVAFKPLPFPDHKIETPDTTNPVKLGEYYVFNLECYSCHSADFKTNNYLNPPLSEGYLAGGNQPLSNEGKPMVTPNLTPDNETGIGLWSEKKFIKALMTGIVEGQPALRQPMVPFTQLTETEAKAIYAYLQTVPALKHKVDRTP
jgi:mono/diheme cytochrome c family protein